MATLTNKCRLMLTVFHCLNCVYIHICVYTYIHWKIEWISNLKQHSYAQKWCFVLFKSFDLVYQLGVSKLIFYQNFASYRLENWLPVIISCHYEVLYDYLKKFLIKKKIEKKNKLIQLRYHQHKGRSRGGGRKVQLINNLQGPWFSYSLSIFNERIKRNIGLILRES